MRVFCLVELYKIDNMIKNYTVYLYILLFFTSVYGAAYNKEESYDLCYKEALNIYVEHLGSLDKMFVIPQDHSRIQIREKVQNTKTLLLNVAQKCLQQDCYIESVQEIMHLVGLTETILYTDKLSCNKSPKLTIRIEEFKVSPRVLAVHEQIRARRGQKQQQILQENQQQSDEYQEALRIYQSFFGTPQKFKITPRESSELKGVVHTQKGTFLKLAHQALAQDKTDIAKKIMKLIGYLECAGASDEKSSPRVIETWAKIMDSHQA